MSRIKSLSFVTYSRTAGADTGACAGACAGTGAGAGARAGTGAGAGARAGTGAGAGARAGARAGAGAIGAGTVIGTVTGTGAGAGTLAGTGAGAGLGTGAGKGTGAIGPSIDTSSRCIKPNCSLVLICTASNLIVTCADLAVKTTDLRSHDLFGGLTTGTCSLSLISSAYTCNFAVSLFAGSVCSCSYHDN